MYLFVYLFDVPLFKVNMLKRSQTQLGIKHWITACSSMLTFLPKWIFPKYESKSVLLLKNVSYLLRYHLIRSSRPEVFCKKGVFRNFAKFTGKHLFQSFFFNKVAGLRLATLLKKRLWHRCFSVNFAEFLRTPFLTEHLRWLLLNNPIHFIAYCARCL